MSIYVRGLPLTYYADDYVPFNSYKNPAFADIATDGSLWPMLIEKMWAKLNGNYESTIGGGTDELFSFLAGVPVKTYSNSGSEVNKSGANAYTLIKAAADKGYVIAASIFSCGSGGDSDSTSLGLICGHAYSIHGGHTVTDNGASVQLIEIRNPWS
jgi:hypothetical protein